MNKDFHIMIKPAGARCNMACAYCFYLPKRGLYSKTTSCRMSDEVLREFTRQYIAIQRGPEMTFAWQGGEPTLMGLDFFVRALRYQNEFGRPGLRIINTLQTNGLLLNDEWCLFLKRHGFLVGLSLDGPRDLHDSFRRDRTAGPSFDKVYDSLQLLKKHGVEHNVLCTVSSANATYPEAVYGFLRDEGVQFIQFIPAVQSGAAHEPEWKVPSLEWGHFLCSVLRQWLESDVGAVFVMNFEAMLASWCGYEQSVCVHSPTCGKTLVLEHGGDVFSCDFFVDADHRLGNIMDAPLSSLVSSPLQTCFGREKSKNLPERCALCPAFFFCQGGCPAHRGRAKSGREDMVYALCEGYRYFYEKADPTMKKLAAYVRGEITLETAVGNMPPAKGVAGQST